MHNAQFRQIDSQLFADVRSHCTELEAFYDCSSYPDIDCSLPPQPAASKYMCAVAHR
ncbi:hypothetical protein DPMN_155976 [Dreissena polymorpha]|uniref:Uncharacterized protein n=1 Tax=Dreissena polymorpha TaxID=45954 RepID=A0A9D4FSQ3_DREPO|nr:hypothetical protein DPMN_155976 [Dreissena polymorpha]